MQTFTPYKKINCAPISIDNIHDFTPQLNSTSAIDLADIITIISPEERLLVYNALNFKHQVRTFEYLPLRIQIELINSLAPQDVASLLNALSPDDRTSLLEELPELFVQQLLKYLTAEERALSIRLLGYAENSVGRLMTPDYIAIKLDWSVRQVLDYIREKGHDSETINVIYAINDAGLLVDDFKIREFLLAPLDKKASEIADHKFISLKVDDPIEMALNVFRKYDRVALPVTDAKGFLLGIVTFDDMIKVAVEQDTEDMQKIGGVQSFTEPYLEISFISLMQKRTPWLLLLFFGEMLTASVIGYFEGQIAKAVVLALFIPLIISSGGNAGSQASTLIIRAIALGEVSLRDWWRIMRREIFSGLFLGSILGLVGFFRITIWSQFSPFYGEHWFAIALTLCFTIIGVVMWGTIAGSMFPLILKRWGFDPAVSSAPFVATLVDVTGLIIYFSVAIIILQGTLL